MTIKRVRVIRRRKIGILIVLLFILQFFITPALLFSDLNFGSGPKNPTDEEQIPNLSTNYLFKGTTYTFNLDDFYDDANLYKVYTGAKFQTEAFNGTSLEWSGVVNNDTVIPVDNDETQYGASSGYYNATYGFDDDTIGEAPEGWANDVEAIIVSDWQEHRKVLQLTRDGSNPIIDQSFGADKTSGTIELWFGSDDVSHLSWFRIQHGSTSVIPICFSSEKIQNYIAGYNEITDALDDTWYHIRIDFECGDGAYEGLLADTYYVYVNGVKFGAYAFKTVVDHVDNIYLICNTGAVYHAYYDAFGYSWDLTYDIGDNIYPDNINMIKGSYDYTDNMKINDDSSTNFTSTHTDGWLYETPSQWDDFTFTEGTGDTIGEIETIDADYSTLISTEAIIIPDEFIDSITYTWAEDAGGTLENTQTDDGNSKDITSRFNVGEGKQRIVITLNFDPVVGGRDFYISAHIESLDTPGQIYINDILWKNGNDIDFDDDFHAGVNSIKYYTTWFIDWHGAEIYYFKIIEDLEGTPALLDVQVDIQVDNPDCSSIEYFKYSHKTNVSATIDLDIWNWDTSVWFEIESIDNFVSFDDDSFTLGLGSDYINNSFGVRIRFQASATNTFQLQIDRFRLDYLIPPAELEITITFPFANYNEDLLAMTIQSWQKTNISQTITFKIWNYDTETWVQISSSSDTSFTKKEYNTESPSNFISPIGTVKLNWTGSDTLDDFELHIDYLFIQIFYKLDLVHSKSFDTNGIYRYRWCVLGSVYYTQWITFEIVDPIPNFHAISESDVTTRWILQGVEITGFENFTDDIDPSSAWDLYDVSPTDFNIYIPEMGDYLTDYITLYGSSYESPSQWGDFSFTKGAGNTIGELETDDADEAIIDSEVDYSDETLLGVIKPDGDILTQWNEGDAIPHHSKIDDYPDMDGDGGNIRESSIGVDDRWEFSWLELPAGHVVTKIEVYFYTKQADPLQGTIIKYTTSTGQSGTIIGTAVYSWKSEIHTGLDISQAQLYGFWINVEPFTIESPSGWVDIETVYIEVYESLKQYSVDYTITWDVDDPVSIEDFNYDYRTTFAVDCDLDIYNWDTTGWLELESNTDANWHTDSYTLTNPYISVSDEIKIRFQSTLTTTDFDMELDMIVLEYNSIYTISKKHNNTIPGYAYMQTNTTELISLNSSVYGANYTLNDTTNDYFEVDFQTSSDSQINLILLKDGVVNATLILSQLGNTNFNRHTVQIIVDDFVEFDQLRFSSTFWDKDYFKCWDIKTYKYEITGDTADFYVGSHQDHNVYLVPDFYNLKIFEGVDKKIDENITIVSGSNDYIYKPTEVIQCRITLFTPEKETYLQFENYHIKINRSLSGEYNQFDLVDVIFYADIETDVYIEVYDRFDSSINNFTRSTTDVYIDLEIEVYSLEIINLMLQKTTIDINTTLYESELASGRWINFMLSKQYYQIGYYNPSNIYTQFIIYLDSNQVYELNMSRICNIYYTNQQMESLSFYQFKTYINGTRIINNMFYATDGEHKGIEVKDLSDISVLNHTYVEGTEELNQISLILTQYSLKVMSQQLVFNHINITRDPTYYASSYYWSEWIAPSEIIDFRLFPGYYVINITNYEDGGWSEYNYEFNGDDVLLIGSNNTIYNVLVNIANVNVTLGNQITNVEINITNQNSAINNTIVNIVINLDNINSTLGTLLLDIDTAISNINTSIISEIVSLGTTINNINSSITDEILNIGVDITNINSSIISEILTLGVDISNINGSIIDQIVLLGVDVTNINTSLTNQILSIGVDIANLDTSITNQILLMIADIENVNASIINQTLVILSDITNMNSTILNQMALLGLNITNVNATIYNQILSLSVDLTNINSSISNLLNNIEISITNLQNDITTFYAFTNTSFINLNNVMNSSFINIENTIYSVNQTISNLVIGVSNDIYLINGTISTMISQLETNLLLMNVSIDTALFGLDTTLNLIGSNITTNYILLNNTLNLMDLNINDSRIAIINNLLLVNNTISTLIADVYSAVYLINNTIYTAVVDLGTYLALVNNTISGNLSIVLETNEFLTELYQMTMFSDLLNWTNIGLDTSLLTSQIDVWTFVNNYKNQSIEVHLRYQDIIEKLIISADDLLEQYLPYDGVEYRLWSVELEEYIDHWEDLDPDEKTIDFGFFDTEVPYDPSDLVINTWTIVAFVVIIAVISIIVVISWAYMKKEKDIVPKKTRNLYKNKRPWKPGTFKNEGI